MLSLGAIHKQSGDYTAPGDACKNHNYKCVECNKDLILCKGKIRIPHFRHKSDNNPCNYYKRPSESQIHKDAKLLLKSLLDKKVKLDLVRECIKCKKDEITTVDYNNISNVNIEYRFEHNGLKIADVACTAKECVKYIFEIYNTHKTLEENRPEPWFEIKACDLIKSVNGNSCNNFSIKCLRDKECLDCYKKKYDLNKLEAECYSFFKEVKEKIKERFTDNFIKYIKREGDSVGSYYYMYDDTFIGSRWDDYLFANVYVSKDFKYFKQSLGSFYSCYYEWCPGFNNLHCVKFDELASEYFQTESVQIASVDKPQSIIFEIN